MQSKNINNNHLELPYSQISCTIKQQGFWRYIRGSECGSILDPNNCHNCLHSISLNSTNKMNCKWTKQMICPNLSGRDQRQCEILQLQRGGKHTHRSTQKTWRESVWWLNSAESISMSWSFTVMMLQCLDLLPVTESPKSLQEKASCSVRQHGSPDKMTSSCARQSRQGQP